MAAAPTPGPLPREVGIVGVGLIGGSLGLALRERLGILPRGYDLPERLAAAAGRGAVEPCTSLEEAVAEAEVVFVATPLGRLAEDVKAVLAGCPAHCAVSDVGSTKRQLVEAIDHPRFIGGHPLAGGERAGVEAARADLFNGASWYLTPGRATADWAFARLHALICALGARPLCLSAARHDRLMAATSHLPHLVANALVEQAAELEGACRPLLAGAAGPSFRDATRVAGANGPLWGEIFLANGPELLARLAVFQRSLRELAALIESGSAQGLAERQEQVARLRRLLLDQPQAGRAVPVGIPAGASLAALALRLGEAGIPIERVEPLSDGGGCDRFTVWVEERAAERARQLIGGESGGASR